MDHCKCQGWATTNGELMLLTGHHENCEHFPGKMTAFKLLIKGLLKGIESWAADEDGVHYDAWEAYRKAKMIIDGVVLPEKEDQRKKRYGCPECNHEKIYKHCVIHGTFDESGKFYRDSVAIIGTGKYHCASCLYEFTEPKEITK